jgi:hypothetical protein
VKRVLLFMGGPMVFTLVFAMASRVAVTQLFRSIENSRATAMRAGTGESGQYQADAGQWISRNGDLRLHPDNFERGRSTVSEIASAHRGFLRPIAARGEAVRCWRRFPFPPANLPSRWAI